MSIKPRMAGTRPWPVACTRIPTDFPLRCPLLRLMLISSVPKTPGLGSDPTHRALCCFRDSGHDASPLPSPLPECVSPRHPLGSEPVWPSGSSSMLLYVHRDRTDLLTSTETARTYLRQHRPYGLTYVNTDRTELITSTQTVRTYLRQHRPYGLTYVNRDRTELITSTETVRTYLRQHRTYGVN